METLFNPIEIWDHNSSDEEPLFEEEEEEEEEVINSSGSSSPISPSNSGPLQHMSSLFQQLPNLKGLSKHYNGKSQSFTCLSKVRCKEDLAKPENPYQKKFKSCKSYAEFPRNNGNSFSSRSRRDSSFIIGNNRPPRIPPNHTHASTTTSNFTNQNPAILFA